jgi:hypothetical protein
MPAIPTETVMGDLNGRGQGVVGAMSGREKISLHKGALIALQVPRETHRLPPSGRAAPAPARRAVRASRISAQCAHPCAAAPGHARADGRLGGLVQGGARREVPWNEDRGGVLGRHALRRADRAQGAHHARGCARGHGVGPPPPRARRRGREPDRPHAPALLRQVRHALPHPQVAPRPPPPPRPLRLDPLHIPRGRAGGCGCWAGR